jgi:hypothetical protein
MSPTAENASETKIVPGSRRSIGPFAAAWAARGLGRTVLLRGKQEEAQPMTTSANDSVLAVLHEPDLVVVRELGDHSAESVASEGR